MISNMSLFQMCYFLKIRLKIISYFCNCNFPDNLVDEKCRAKWKISPKTQRRWKEDIKSLEHKGGVKYSAKNEKGTYEYLIYI